MLMRPSCAGARRPSWRAALAGAGLSSSTNVVATHVAVIVEFGSGLSLPFTSSAADVHDARELADAIEEDREVVVRAVELEADRPLGVQLLGDGRRRLEALDRQVRLRRDASACGAADRRRPSLRAAPPSGCRGAPRGRPTCAAELRQLASRSSAPLVMSALQRLQLRSRDVHVGARRHLVVVVERAARRRRRARRTRRPAHTTVVW